jgi:hypothetical protein
MPDDPDTRLVLRQADQLRTDIANLECGQEFLMQQIARLATRGDVWCAVAMGMLGGSVLTTGLGLAFFLR